MMPDHLFLWIAFNVFVLGVLALDLGVFHRKAHGHRISLHDIALGPRIALVFSLSD